MNHRTPNGYNHPHWDHSAPPAPTAASRWNSPRLRHALRRAHLPVHPVAPLVLIVVGAAWCVSLAELLGGTGGTRAGTLAALAIVGPLALLGLGLMLTGTWDLVRVPLRRLRKQARH